MSDLKQYFEDDGNGNVSVINKHNLDPILKECAERRKENPKGFSPKKTQRTVAQIPEYMFQEEPLLREVVRYSHTNNQYAKRCMKLFLQLHPELKTSEGSL